MREIRVYIYISKICMVLLHALEKYIYIVRLYRFDYVKKFAFILNKCVLEAREKKNQ